MASGTASDATPFIRLSRFSPDMPVYALAEHLRPSGSVFDRIAGALVAEKRSQIEAQGRVVFGGSGSACLAFASALARLRVETTAVVSKGALPEHLDLLKRHRLTVHFSEVSEGLPGVHAAAARVAAERSALRLYTPLEESSAERVLFESLSGSPETSAALRQIAQSGPGRLTLCVPEVSSALVAAFAAWARAIVPGARVVATVREERDELQDDVFTVSSTPTRGVERVSVSDAAASACRSEVARREGLLVGLSSAAALSRVRGAGGPCVTVVVDAGDRYFSVDRGLSRGGAPR